MKRLTRVDVGWLQEALTELEAALPHA